MIIQFENMREPVRLRGMSTNRPAYGAGTRAGSLPLFIPQSILSDASLPFRQLSQPVPNVFKIFETALMVLGTAAAMLVGTFILLFVKF